jgi:phenylalanyl-tRNA synthetase beta chain
MHISRNWLQTFFDQPLPDVEALSDALTFHAFEIDGVEKVGKDDVLDVKVTPNRGHDALSHRGIAKELSAILKLPLKTDPLSHTLQSESKTWPSGLERSSGQSVATVAVSIQNSDLCKRYIAGYIKGVEVKESPEWLKTRLEAIGQRSINNIVDATNYVMFNLGQPLHAFDAAKLGQKDGTYAITVRTAQAGEKLMALDEKEYTLSDSMLVIADANSGVPIGIAGVKGGMPAGITSDTKDIILESANFDGVSVRKTAQALKLRTDASARFEQVLSPELAGYGMQAVVELIKQIAGGEVVGFVDEYPNKQQPWQVSVTTAQVTKVLGDTFGEKEIIDSFDRLGFLYTKEDDVFVVTASFERLDLQIAEDLIEEVGRIIGYDHVPPLELPPFSREVEVNQNFYWTELVREWLVSLGFSEVFTSVFSEKGERTVLNKVDGMKPYLRDSLVSNLQEVLDRNVRNKEHLGLRRVGVFEIGMVWNRGVESLMLGIAAENLKGEKTVKEIFSDMIQNPDVSFNTNPEKTTLEVKIADMKFPQQGPYDDLLLSQTQQYKPFSKFPYIVRDVAFWTSGTSEQEVAELIKNETGELCVKIALFDTFQKGDKVSYAFRLIFQSFEKTLTDEEVNGVMEKVYEALKAKGFEIR